MNPQSEKLLNELLTAHEQTGETRFSYMAYMKYPDACIEELCNSGHIVKIDNIDEDVVLTPFALHK